MTRKYNTKHGRTKSRYTAMGRDRYGKWNGFQITDLIDGHRLTYDLPGDQVKKGDQFKKDTKKVDTD